MVRATVAVVNDVIGEIGVASGVVETSVVRGCLSGSTNSSSSTNSSGSRRDGVVGGVGREHCFHN